MNRTLMLNGCAALLVIATAGARADELRYTYVDAGYAQVDFDDFDDEADGLFVRGSLELGSNAFVFAGYRDLSVDVAGFDIDTEELTIGAGVHVPVTTKIDVTGRLGYVDIALDGPFGASADDDGFQLAAGLRGSVTERFELEGEIVYTDLDESGDDTSFRASGRYAFTDLFSAGVELGVGDDVTEYGVYGRFTF